MKKNLIAVLIGVLILLSVSVSLAEEPRRPFPQNPTYREETLLPLDGGAETIETVCRLYDEWKEKYFRYSPYDADQAYVDWHGEEGITVSEAHGYGMLALAYMAGYDADAQRDFDAMVRFYLAHPSAIDPALMAWQQADDGEKIIDINGVDSATDGDLDIAYALLLADEQWGSDGEFNYKELALRSINATMNSVVNKEEWILLVGDWAHTPGEEAWYRTRPSDFMLGHFAAFYRATGDERWLTLSDSILKAIEELVATESPECGLLPNFAKWENGKFVRADDSYSWDACRVPWRLGVAAMTENISALDETLDTINRFAYLSSGGNPRGLCCGYALDGTKLVEYLDPAFAAPFMVSAMRGSDRLFLNDLWRWNMRQTTASGGYYDNSIRLLCAIAASGQWWTPCNS